MKKIITLMLCALFAFNSIAQVSAVYVNPLQTSTSIDKVVALRLFKKGMLGLTKAKTITVASGDKVLAPGSADAQAYDYILTMTISDVTIEEAGTVNNLLGALGSKSAKKEPDYEAAITTDITVTNAKSGEQVFATTLKPSSTDKDKNVALFDATNNFDSDMTDMTDDAFRVYAEILEPLEIDSKKDLVKTARLQLGSKSGARKSQSFEIYKVTGENREMIGKATCQQILGENDCVISISGKDDGHKKLSSLIKNNDGSYTLEAWSRSRAGLGRDIARLAGVDKTITKEGRPTYLDPFSHGNRAKVGVLNIAINDANFTAQKDNLVSEVASGMGDVRTIEFMPTIYGDVANAKSNGLHGLVEVSIDKVYSTTERTKEGKTEYKTKILYTVTGIDVNGNKWLDMRSFHDYGSSTESAAKSKTESLTLMADNIKKYLEDLYPVAGRIINSEEVDTKKESVKKARIDIGTEHGLTKGMKFDIFEQRKDGDADSRNLLGEASVEKDGLTANEAIVKIKGKKNADKKLYDIIQNADENTELILVSKASYTILDKGLNILSR